MLVGAVSRNGDAHSYQFSQIPELSECLTVSARRERYPLIRPAGFVPKRHC